MSIATFNSSCIDMTDYYTIPMEMLRVWDTKTGLYRIKRPEEIKSMRGMTFKTAINIAEVEAEAKAKNANIADIPDELVCKFENLTQENFTSTGDAEQDYAIELGLKYKRSCFNGNVVDGDIRLLDYKITEDLSEMTPAEKYKAIYEKYQHCYGENFLYAEAADYVSHPFETDDYIHVINKFKKEIKTACGKDCNMAKLRRNALYPDMNEAEIQNAIVEKFDTSDGISLIELNQIAYEMKSCGIDHGIHNLIFMSQTAEESHILYQNAVLHKQQPFQNYHNARDKAMHSNVPSEFMNRLKDKCERIYGGNADIMGTYEFFNSLVKEANGISSGKSLMDQYNGINGLKL